MALESPNLSPYSPEDFDALRRQVAELNERVQALERDRVSVSRVMSAPVAVGNSDARLGLTLVNRVGAVTLALGILFFFKYAAENNWIGPVARVLLGLVFAAAFLLFGELLSRRGQRALAYGISGCGIAILYTATYASSAYYKLLLPGAVFFLLVAVSALTVTLAMRYGNQMLGCFGIGLAVFTLPLMHGGDYVVLPTPYLLAVSAVGLLLAARRKWTFLAPWTTFAVLLCASVLRLEIAIFDLLAAALAAGCWIAQSRLKDSGPLVPTLYVTGHVAVLIGSLRAIDTWITQASLALAISSVLLGFYGLTLLSVSVARRSQVDRVVGLTLIGIVVLKLYLYDVWQLSYGVRIAAFVALGILLLGASFVYSRYKTRT